MPIEPTRRLWIAGTVALPLPVVIAPRSPLTTIVPKLFEPPLMRPTAARPSPLPVLVTVNVMFAPLNMGSLRSRNRSWPPTMVAWPVRSPALAVILTLSPSVSV